MTGPSIERGPLPLLLLHGALGAGIQMNALAAALETDGPVVAPDFMGHGAAEEGGTRPGMSVAAPGEEQFGIARFAADVLSLLDHRGFERADLFGYSMGGYVALFLARHHPGRVRRIMTLGTKFAWEPEAAAKEVSRLDPAKIETKVPAFAARLRELHGERWGDVVRSTAGMMTALGAKPALAPDDLRVITHRCLVAVGDRDAMVTLAETASAARELPAGECLVLPGTPHPLEQVPRDPLLFHLRRFLTSED